jgi:uncharacterized protein
MPVAARDTRGSWHGTQTSTSAGSTPSPACWSPDMGIRWTPHALPNRNGFGRAHRQWYNDSMITDADRRVIGKLAAKYGAQRVILFGSSLSPSSEGHDIDIGVEGIAEENFFTFYGELLCALSRPVDVIDLSRECRFVEMVKREGVPLHG